MEYHEAIDRALDYIENNLTANLALADVARAAGYSAYHFLRVFRAAVSMTPADYIRKRRLSEDVRAMETAGRPLSELAFTYGFNSKENFTRAFRAEHHVLPTEYKTTGNSLKLYERGRFEFPKICVEPAIVTLEGFAVVAFASDEDYAPNFWNKYNCKRWSRRLSGGADVVDYGVCLWNDARGAVDYWIGVRQDEAVGDTAGTVRVDIADGTYAVFATPPTTHFNFVNTIHRTWRYINEQWLPGREFRRVSGMEFECYRESSRIYSEDIYIPIERT